MIELHSKSLQRTIKIDRVIGRYQGNTKGPTLIFMGGVHGNEPSGVFALQSVLDELRESDTPFNGVLYAIGGNLTALRKGVRYTEVDLNRIWTKDTIKEMNGHDLLEENEDKLEQIEIHKTINTILDTEEGPFYFFDLHTTSGESCPFLTVNDSLLNRRFTKQYPVPIVLGIEEYLIGPLLSYINEMGYVAFGFEGGQHDSPLAYKNHKSFIYLSLLYAGCYSETNPTISEHHQWLVTNCKVPKRFFEIIYHYHIKDHEKFKMIPGYVNFQRIQKNEELAMNTTHEIYAPKAGKIFMPLYQGIGEDGFFIIRKIPNVFLGLSAVLRKTYFDRILVLLPGISWGSNKREELVVNLKVARFFTKKFFHLLGYRSKQIDKTHLRMKNREAASRTKDYEGEDWM